MILPLRFFHLPALLLCAIILCSRLHAQVPQLAAVFGSGKDAAAGVTMEMRVSIEIYPLLTSVFFEPGSAVIPDRYAVFANPAQTAGFADTAIPGSTLTKYRHVLNIIGYRMRIHPQTRVEIAGMRSGDIGETRDVAAGRGQVVHDYLVNIWHIDPARIKLLPLHDKLDKSSARDSLQPAHDRRVEIRSGDWEIVKPVVHREVRPYPNPSRVAFSMKDGISSGWVARSSIEIRRGGTLWHVMEGINHGDRISPSFNWGWQGNHDSLPADTIPYTAQLVVYGNDGRAYRSNEVRIPVEVIPIRERKWPAGPPTKVETYRIAFLAEGKLSILNERIIREYICGRLGRGVRVEIVGITDIIGLSDRNKRLSEMQARMVGEFLRQCARPGAITSLATEGRGEGEPLHSNRLPEGRCYNRTVSVTVTIPPDMGE